nr:LmeA family phospholipid-binding protein [Gordonia araii]
MGGSELYLRHQVTSCLSKAFASITGAPTKVSLSGKPMLLQAWSKEIPFVQVNSTGDGDSEGELDLRVEDIRSTGEASTIGKITGTGYVPFDQVVKSAQEGGGMLGSPPGGAGGAGGPGQIERISGNADGTFDVATTVTAVIIPVPVTVTLRPGVRDGKAYFEVVRADVVGFGIPPDFAQNIVDEVTTATFGSTMRNLSLSKLGMRGSGGIEFAVNGSDITVDENLVRPRTDCAEVTTAAG